jgi:hypothetical protein
VLLRRVATYLPPLLVGLLAIPFILHQNSYWEWANPYWLLQRQTEYVGAHGVPTLFLHQQSGVFNPFYVYYAGPVLSALAYPAQVFGPWTVFTASVVVAIVCGYLGIWWAARNVGLSPVMAILPALVFTTTPYVLSEMYGRGAWGELLGVNAAAVVVGGTTALLWHPERRNRGALVALAAATAVLAGAHNLSLMLTALLVPLLLLALLPSRAPLEARATLRAAGRGLFAVALGAGLVAAWLLPNLWNGRSTWIALKDQTDRVLFEPYFGQLELSNVLSPVPHAPPEFGRTLYGQAPSLAWAWLIVALAAAVALRRGGRGRLATTAIALNVLGVALLLLIIHLSWWGDFPQLFHTIQFPFRLTPYLAMAVALGVAVALTALRGRARAVLGGALVVIVAFQVVGGVRIVTESERFAPIPLTEQLTPATFTAASEPTAFSHPDTLVQYQFRVVKDPTGPTPDSTNIPGITVGNFVTAERGRIDGIGSVGQHFTSPVVWSPYVRVTGGARISGRNYDGLAVLEVTRSDRSGRWRATAEPASPWTLVLGRVISGLSALTLAAWTAVALAGRRRRQANLSES